MKKLYSLLLLFVSVMGFAQYTVNFEGTGETKTGYNSGAVTLSGLQWNMTDALIGVDAADWKNGVRSARMRGYATSSMTMIQDKVGGLGTLSFSYRRYGTDAQVAWRVEYSTNAGESWTQAGTSITATADVQNFSQVLNLEGNVRVRIVADIATGTANRRMNIDDITLTDYSSSSSNALITLTPNSLTDLDYILGTGPSTAQTFQIAVADLTPAAGSLNVEASSDYEISTDNSSFLNVLNISYADNVLSNASIFVRLKSNLSTGVYAGSVLVSGGGASDKSVSLNGEVVAPFAIPYINDFRTQANLDAATSVGFTYDGAVIWGGTGGGGYTRMPDMSSIVSPSITFAGEDFLQVSFALTTFGGNTGQVLALKYSNDNGATYETINTFSVPASYRTFTQIVHLDGFNGVGKLKFEMISGTNQIRFRDLSIQYVDAVVPAINPVLCGTTINSASNGQITLAQGYDGDMYEFTLSNGVQSTVIEKPEPSVTFSDFGNSNFVYGETYNIAVRIKYGSTYTLASPACAITLTSTPLTSVEFLCGQTVQSVHSRIYVFSVPNTTSYRYSIKNLTTDVEQFFETNKRYFTFASLPTFDFATNYEIKAQVKLGGVYGDFGPACTVTTPLNVFSKLRDAFCGITLTNLNDNVFATFLVNADGYKFRITANGVSQEIERPDTRFSFAFASNIQLNQTYDVEVAVRFNGVYGPYSDICTVTTPATLPTSSLRPQFCGATLNALNANFFARFVVGATAYRFKTMINGQEVVVERPDSRCFMTAFAGAVMNQTYQIQVAVNINGVWSEYGSTCSLMFGTGDVSKISQEATSWEMSVFPNPSSSGFQINFNKTVSNGTLSIYDLSGKLIQNIAMNEVQSVAFGNDFLTGIYLAKFTSNDFSKTIKIVKN
ncbi:MAG: T9SS type A sorting domain-containing protein [Flavobacterium sp.]